MHRRKSILDKCRDCDLYRLRTQVVGYRGNAKEGVDLDVLFVGEAPGKQEDLTGIPFIGASGQLLTEKIERLETAGTVYLITNVVKCRPPNNKFSKKYVQACRKHLMDDVKIFNPALIVAIGSSAMEELTGEVGIKARSGNILRSKDIYGTRMVIPIIHPAAVLYDRNANKTIWDSSWEKLYEHLEMSQVEEYW